jgi:SAM-dependent methyltransferase
MKNLLNERPDLNLHTRLKFSNNLVDVGDIRNKKVLDIGCGFGWFELNALKKGVREIAGIEITALDLQPAKENIKDKRAIFKIGGALKLPFGDNYFDTVVAWEVIEHIPKNTENKMFSEVRRVLKKNGVFYLSTPYDSFWSKYFDPAWWLIGHRHYSKEKLIDCGNKNGLSVAKIYLKGRWWGLVNLLNLYIAKWIFRRESFSEDKLITKEDHEYESDKGFMGIFVKFEKRSN